MGLGTLNIIQALHRSTARMKRSNASRKEKALDLCWIFHLVGDLHQPLHSTALFSEKGFPAGDRGGNGVKVGSSNLHSLWDRSAGTGESLASLTRRAREWSNQLSTVGEDAAAITDILVWVDESHRAAGEFTYTEEIIDAVRAQHDALLGEATLEGGTAPISVSRDYREMAREISRERFPARKSGRLEVETAAFAAAMGGPRWPSSY